MYQEARTLLKIRKA